MAYSYQQFTAGQTHIRFIAGCVLGFSVRDREDNTETLYALNEDGRVKVAVKLDPRTLATFNKVDRLWHDCPEVPADAEFIGCYPAEMF